MRTRFSGGPILPALQSQAGTTNRLVMAMTPIEELRHPCSHILATVGALRKELAAAGRSTLDSKADDRLEPLKRA